MAPKFKLQEMEQFKEKMLEEIKELKNDMKKKEKLCKWENTQLKNRIKILEDRREHEAKEKKNQSATEEVNTDQTKITHTVQNARALNIMGKLLQQVGLNIVNKTDSTISLITDGNADQIEDIMNSGTADPFLNALETTTQLCEAQNVSIKNEMSGDLDTLEIPESIEKAIKMCTENKNCPLKKGNESMEMNRSLIDILDNLDLEQFLKQCNIAANDETSSLLQECNLTSLPMPMSKKEILKGMKSNDESIQLKATQACLLMLSSEKSPTNSSIIHMGVVPRCIDFLTRMNNPSLQNEALQVLNCITNGPSEQTQLVVEEGALPKLKDLVRSPHPDVSENAILVIVNIANASTMYRDVVVHCQILPALLTLLNPKTSDSVVRIAVWAIGNILRRKDAPIDFALFQQCVKMLAPLLHYDDKEVLSDTCWALSYLADSNEQIQAILDTGLIIKLVELLNSNEVKILTPALRTIGMIVTGNDVQTEKVLDAGILNIMGSLLQNDCLNIVNTAAWTISNITAGNVDQIEKVLNAGIMNPLLKVLQTGELKSQKEAAWAVLNYTNGGTDEQLMKLVDMGALKTMCILLNSMDCKLVVLILDAITNIFRAASKFGQAEKVAKITQDCGGKDFLEVLKFHNDGEVSEKSLYLIENYFSEKILQQNTNFRPVQLPEINISQTKKEAKLAIVAPVPDTKIQVPTEAVPNTDLLASTVAVPNTDLLASTVAVPNTDLLASTVGNTPPNMSTVNLDTRSHQSEIRELTSVIREINAMGNIRQCIQLAKGFKDRLANCQNEFERNQVVWLFVSKLDTSEQSQ